MSTTMNSRSITDYILKLEKENHEQAETIRTLTFNEIGLKKEIRDFKKTRADTDSHEVSRFKIEQLKKLYQQSEKERVQALKELLSYRETVMPIGKDCPNQGIIDRLLELGDMTSDFYKTAAYQRAADVIRNLDYEVESGESLLNLNGIGKGIATKIDEYLEEQDSDYVESDVSDEESVASNDPLGLAKYDSDSDDDESFVSETDDEEYFVSHNAGLSEMIYECADRAEDNFKRNAYARAGDTIYNLSYKITSGKDAMKLRGIGKSIAKKIDDYLFTSS